MVRQRFRLTAGALLGAAALLLGPAPARAAALPLASHAATGGRTAVPYGWVDFCTRYAPECDGPALPAADLDLTPRSLATLDKVNREVNAAIKPVTDQEHWGVPDRWDYPLDGRGDCEDYALLKRKLLIAAGIPRQALLLTVVRDLDGEGHAVLTVLTSRGDFVLDNLADKVKPWTATGYGFVKRQSQEDPNRWVSIGAPVPAPAFTARP